MRLQEREEEIGNGNVLDGWTFLEKSVTYFEIIPINFFKKELNILQDICGKLRKL